MRRYEAHRLIREGDVTWERLRQCLDEIAKRPDKQSRVNPAITRGDAHHIFASAIKGREGAVDERPHSILIATNILREYGSLRQYRELCALPIPAVEQFGCDEEDRGPVKTYLVSFAFTGRFKIGAETMDHARQEAKGWADLVTQATVCRESSGDVRVADMGLKAEISAIKELTDE